MTLIQYAEVNLIATLLTLCRVGAIIMLMPAISKNAIPARAKAALSFMIALLLQFRVTEQINVTTIHFGEIAMISLCLSEVTTGIILGSIVRMIMNAAQVSGSAITYQIGLSSASMFDPSTKAQGTSMGVLLNAILIAMIFFTNLHMLYISAIGSSYDKFPISTLFGTTITLDIMLTVFRNSWVVGMEIAFPLMIGSIIMLIGAGILSRLMPKLQILFIILPAQIALGFFILMGAMTAICIRFSNYYVESLKLFE